MKKRTIPVLLLSLAYHAGMAQKPHRDTLALTSKIHQIDEVVVTGKLREVVWKEIQLLSMLLPTKLPKELIWKTW